MGDNGHLMPDHTDALRQTLDAAERDRQTVRPDGGRVDGLLEGMRSHRSRVHTDERGSLTELFDPRWDWHPDPIITAYYITERPGQAKGWALHKEHEDRYAIISGELEVVLYDVRPDSATYRQVCRFAMTDRDPMVVSIPVLVWHATRTLGTRDAVLVNFPTRPYDYEAPDKYRLPLDTPLIPFDFGGTPGW